MVKRLLNTVLKEFCKLFETLFVAFLNSNMSIFKLHYSFTVKILVTFALLNVLRNYFGIPITCIADSSLNYIIDSYCANIPSHIIQDPVMRAQPVNATDSKVKYYYQTHRWIFFMLILQAVSFYLPHYVAKMFEGDLMDAVNPNCVTEAEQSSLDQRQLTEEQATQSTNLNMSRKKQNVDYFASNLNNHRLYAIVYIICEILNLANVILQLFLINYFFIGNGTNFPDPNNILHLLENPKKRVDPLSRSLPQFTQCVFYKPGPGGMVVIYDAECALAVNSTNQLIVAVLSYWFFILTVFSGLALVSRFLVCCRQQIRKKILKARSPFRDDDHEPIETIYKNFPSFEYADWFVLYQLKKHCDYFAYREFIQDLSRKFN